MTFAWVHVGERVKKCSKIKLSGTYVGQVDDGMLELFLILKKLVAATRGRLRLRAQLLRGESGYITIYNARTRTHTHTMKYTRMNNPHPQNTT